MGRCVFLLRRRRSLAFWGAGLNLPGVLVLFTASRMHGKAGSYRISYCRADFGARI